MATGSKAGLYQNPQSASYLPLTLVKINFPALRLCASAKAHPMKPCNLWANTEPCTKVAKKLFHHF